MGRRLLAMSRIKSVSNLCCSGLKDLYFLKLLKCDVIFAVDNLSGAFLFFEVDPDCFKNNSQSLNIYIADYSDTDSPIPMLRKIGAYRFMCI